MESDISSEKESTSLISTRPVSRRGLRTSASVDIPSTSESPLASVQVDNVSLNRGVSAIPRPPSSVRIGTASRLASAISNRTSTANPNRIGSALSNIGNMKIVDRPITQMGLTGLQTGQSKVDSMNSNRKVKDERYWIDLIQAKIKQIDQESARLLKEKEEMDKEILTKPKLEKEAKEATKELTEMQDQLADLNIALDSINSGVSSQTLQKEANALRERNESLQLELEKLFTENQEILESNKQLENEIEIAKQKANEKIQSLPPEEQQKYHEIQKVLEGLRKEHIDLQNEVDDLTQKCDYLNSIIEKDPMKAEVARLQEQLDDLEEQYEKLKEEHANKLTPEQEEEKLLLELKENNLALAKINNQVKIAQKDLADAKEELQTYQQDVEEMNSNSEKYAKYRELKRRDEIMTEFLDSFPEELEREQAKIEELKNEITYVVEAITLSGIDLKDLGLKESDLLNENNDLTTKAGAIKEYKRLSIQLKQLELLEQRTTSQLKQLEEEEAELLNEISHYSNVEQLRSDAAEKMEVLTAKLEELTRKERITEEVVAEAKKRCDEIKEELRSNETYKEIAHLEDKLFAIDTEIKTLQDVIDEKKKAYDYSSIKNECDQMVNEINQLLIEGTKNKSTEDF